MDDSFEFKTQTLVKKDDSMIYVDIIYWSFFTYLMKTNSEEHSVFILLNQPPPAFSEN